MTRFSLLLMAAPVLTCSVSHAMMASAEASHDRRFQVDRHAESRDTLSFSMSSERWKHGSVPSIGAFGLLDVPGKYNAELHWYSPYAVVKESDFDPTLTDLQGARNNREVLALSIPRRPISAGPSDTLWVSLTYPLDPAGLDYSAGGFIEFWVNDWRDTALVRGPGLKLHVDLGSVSEDQMRAPNQHPNLRLDTEDRSPPDGQLRPEEDSGVDGVGDSVIDNLWAPLDLATAIAPDMAGDNYNSPLNNYAEIDPRRWIGTNGTEGNRSVSPAPDTEDLNLNFVLDTREDYFEYSIDLSDTSQRYLVTDVYADFAGGPHPPRDDNGWRRYRIPIGDAARVQFGTPDLALSRHVRIWVDGIMAPDRPANAELPSRPILMLAGITRTTDYRKIADLGYGAPNPFTTSTTFAFRLEARASVRAVVLDVQGRKVAMLEDGDFNAGNHGLMWDGRHADGRLAPPGLYFVRARIEGRSDRLWRVIRLK